MPCRTPSQGICAPWWPYAEATGSGRNGRDITGTPGVAFEVKTADDLKASFKPTIWIRQAQANAGSGEVPVVVYFPRGLGAAHTGQALAILPVDALMEILEGTQFAPGRKEIP
jgi:hypothetical protein